MIRAFRAITLSVVAFIATVYNRVNWRDLINLIILVTLPICLGCSTINIEDCSNCLIITPQVVEKTHTINPSVAAC